ncbi:MAG: DNA-directed RNA polymerase subunit N [Nanoarchaeota archaeon]|nr:DNA-directed RNA polymerase subunit N [Nanoarchaeota archaeon]
MIIPIRCISCGKPIGHLYEKYKKQIKEGKDAKQVLDGLGLERMCCRSVFLTHVDMIPKIGVFKK